jgi:hypothetical protein
MVFLKTEVKSMELPTGLRLFSKFLTLGLLVTCIVLLTRGVGPTGYASARRSQTAATQVSVKPQPDAPLRLSVVSYDSSDPQSPAVRVEVTNAGPKVIRAYSVSQQTTKGDEKSSSVLFSDTGVLGRGIQAGQQSTDEIPYPAAWDEDSRMSLAIDLVEFADGTTWGPDEEQSSEILAGRRAGERQAAKRLLKLYKEKGTQETINSLGDRSLEVPPPDGYPSQWKEGFRNGQSGMASRLKRAMSNGGARQVEEELRKLSEKFTGGN